MIRVIVVEDEGLLNELISDIVGKEEEIEVVGNANEGRKAIQLCRQLMPDLVIMDIGMPNGLNGIEATKIIKESFKNIKVLILTSFKDQRLEEAVKNGADSYLLKGTSKEILIDYIKRTANGEKLNDSNYDNKYLEKKYKLTNKQVKIFKLLTKGKNSSDIAYILDKSEQNIKNHMTNIYKKVEVKNITSFMLFCAKENLL